jgi:uncharacterized lipoprotein YajG
MLASFSILGTSFKRLLYMKLKRVNRSRLLLLCAVVLICGCTYRIERSVPVHLVPALEIDSVERFAPSVSLDVGEFIDGRSRAASNATRNSAEEKELIVVQAEGDVSTAIKSTLQKFIRARQTGNVHKEVPRITGTIRRWEVEVERGGFALVLNARAVLDVDLRDKDNKVLFSAHYIGITTAQEVYARERRLRQLLSEAMGQALSELMNDKELNQRIAAVASSDGYLSPLS